MGKKELGTKIEGSIKVPRAGGLAQPGGQRRGARAGVGHTTFYQQSEELERVQSYSL